MSNTLMLSIFCPNPYKHVLLHQFYENDLDSGSVSCIKRGKSSLPRSTVYTNGFDHIKSGFRSVRPKHAHRLFDELPHRKNSINEASNLEETDSSDTILASSLLEKQLEQNWMDSMIPRETFLDQDFIVRSLRLCAHSSNLELGKNLHVLGIKRGYHNEKRFATTLINLYANCKEIENALKVFNGLSCLDVVSWNSMISGFSKNRFNHEAMSLFVQAFMGGTIPNKYTFTIVLNVCTNLLGVQEGKQVHAHVIKSQCLHETEVGNSLLTMYSKFGMMEEAEILFKKLDNKTVISWTAMITGLYKNGNMEEALKQFYRMKHSQIEPNEYTLTTVLAASGQRKCAKSGRSIHSHTIKTGFISSIFVATAIINMYSAIGEMGNAERQFTLMGDSQSTESWNALMAGLVLNERYGEAMHYLGKMFMKNVHCDHFTYSNILKACSVLPSLSSGEQIHAQIIKTGHILSIHVASSLLEMYANCGCLRESEQVFAKMEKRDSITWNSIIKAHSQNGSTDKAIHLFQEMAKQSIEPTSNTFLAILSACSHSGKVEQGMQIFDSMVKDYGIIPEDTHYSCIVDLKSRAGQLEEALDFIKSLPIKPSISIYRPLLGACRSYHNFSMAEKISKYMIDIDPNDPTVYLSLSNICVDAGRLVDAENHRKTMMDRNLKKEPGSSWIEVDNKLHFFFSRDKTHRKKENIYEKLEELLSSIQKMGYIPDKDPYSTSKKHHSEKIAVAFGIISLSPSKPIRIFKNLRVCNDCHNAMKYISRATKREIVVRDNYRFHCFKMGSCSCGDYW